MNVTGQASQSRPPEWGQGSLKQPGLSPGRNLGAGWIRSMAKRAQDMGQDPAVVPIGDVRADDALDE